MRVKLKRREFHDLVGQAHKAIDEFAEGRERDDWFPRGLDEKARQAVENLVTWSVEKRKLTERHEVLKWEPLETNIIA